jgi:hypothetical protein
VTDSSGETATSAAVSVVINEILPNLKIALIGDQGLNPDSIAVLNLIKDEGAETVMLSGDLDYSGNPSAWDAQNQQRPGSEFPVLCLDPLALAAFGRNPSPNSCAGEQAKARSPSNYRWRPGCL